MYYDTLSEALADLKKRGCRYDFNLKPGRLECPAASRRLFPDIIGVDEVHCLDIADPGDAAVL